MNNRLGMATRTWTVLTVGASVGLATAFLSAGCSSTESNGGAQTGGGGSTSTDSGSGGASQSSTATNSTAAGGTSSGGASSGVGSSSATGGSVATGPGVWATIKVELTPKTGTSEAYTSVEAFGKDAAPLPDLFTTTKTVGDCKLLEPKYVACLSPKCAASVETCVADDTCKKTPASAGMGNLTFSGLTLQSGSTDSFSVSPINNTYVAAGSTGVAYPPCTPGKEVSVTGGADDATKFAVKAGCIDPLTVTGADPIPFKPGEVTKLTWQAPSVSGSRMMVRIDISHHGGLKGLIVCDAADNGSLSVDGTLVTGLIQLGTAGFPVARLTRINTATSAAGSGTATINVQSWVERSLEIPGVVSCSTEMPCPSGQTCTAFKCEG